MSISDTLDIEEVRDLLAQATADLDAAREAGDESEIGRLEVEKATYSSRLVALEEEAERNA